MRDGVLLSGTLHVVVLLLVLFGLPFFWEPETVHMTATPVTVVTSDMLTAPKVAQEAKAEPKEEPPQPEIPPAPPAPTLPEPEVIPEPPAAPEETQNETPPVETPNPEPQESANPQEEDTPEPVIAEPPPEPPPPEPVPVPVPDPQVAEVQDVPVPPQKPEPPKKKEVKKKDEKKPVNDEQNVNSLIDKLAKEQTAAVPPAEESPAEEPQTEGIPQRLPAGEEDALRNYIRGCWFSTGGGASATELVVTLEIKLNPDATLRSVEISRKDRARMGDPVYRSFAESAKRAVDKCGADRQAFPLNLQRDYAVWGYILARFRESDFY